MKAYERAKAAPSGQHLADAILEEENKEEESKTNKSFSALNKSSESGTKRDQIESLWLRVRNLLNEKDEYGYDLPVKQGGRKRFAQQCDFKSRKRPNMPNVLEARDVIQAFTTSGLVPVPTDAEFRALFSALDVYHDEENELVNWSAILAAPVNKEL